MDCSKVGKLIFDLRREKGLTQLQLAAKLNVSDKTISKWECGMGCPDVSLLGDLSRFFGVNIEKILEGALSPNESDSGNMRRLKFYQCPDCKNIVTATGNAEVYCCGRRLTPLEAKSADAAHDAEVEIVEDDFFITFDHAMTKEHYIAFAAYVSCDRVLLVRLYPEQEPSVRFMRMRGGKLLWCCSEHGLFEKRI